MKLIKESTDIKIKNPGVLEVPEGKKVDELPLSHFEKLVDKKGYDKVIRALNNLQVWNKNDDKSLSAWAKSTMNKLKKKYRKDESYLQESAATLTPEEEKDNEIINKILRRLRSNRDYPLTPEMQEVMDKYGLKVEFGELSLIDPNSRVKYMSLSSLGPNIDDTQNSKVNWVDKIKKKKERNKAHEYISFQRNDGEEEYFEDDRYNVTSYNPKDASSFQVAKDRKYQTDVTQRSYGDRADRIRRRKILQQEIDKLQRELDAIKDFRESLDLSEDWDDIEYDEVSFPHGEPKIGDKFKSPRGSHVVREIFKTKSEANNTPEYGYWFTTDDYWDVFAFEGNGYSVGIAPSYVRRMKASLKEDFKDWKDYKFLVKFINQPEMLVGVAATSREKAIDIAKNMYAQYYTTFDDGREDRWEIKELEDEKLEESISKEDLTTINSLIDKAINNTESKEFKKGWSSERSKTVQASVERLKNLKKEINKLSENLNEDVEPGEKKEIESTPETPEDNALTTQLNMLVKSEYDAIDDYNSVIQTAKDLNRQDIVDILTTIAHDENTHVGNLLVATKLVNPQTQAIDKGEKQAVETLEGDVVIEEKLIEENK